MSMFDSDSTHITGPSGARYPAAMAASDHLRTIADQAEQDAVQLHAQADELAKRSQQAIEDARRLEAFAASWRQAADAAAPEPAHA